MKKSLIYVTIAVILLIITILFFFKRSVGGNCTDFSNKDGYTGCMNVTKGKDKRCKFKVNNKINQSTQQMEFEYLCQEK